MSWIVLLLLGATSVVWAEPAAPPVERRAEQLFEALRGGGDAELVRFVEDAMGPEFLDMAPVEAHVEQLGQMRETLGAFEVDQIRISDPHRGDFVLRTNKGESLLLHLETLPIEPYRLGGIGLEPYNPERDIPEYGSLEQVDTHLQRLAQANEFSGVVLVAREGRPEWTRAYGMANKEAETPNSLETRFDIGSITKSMTGVAVMQLVEAGKVDLEAPMSRYLTGFPSEIADRVRVIDLLRMESGYGDYFGRAFMERREELREVSDFLELFRGFSLEFEPGTRQRYSNVGYVILGGIVESASGMLYRDYVRERIFKPAGMRDSSFRDLESFDPRSAVGYTNDGPTGRRGYADTNHSIMETRGTPAGGSCSTAADLLRFNRALEANRLLSQAGTSFMLGRYGDSNDRPKVRAVAGGAPGVSAVSFEDTAAGVTVIVLSNYDEPLAEDVGRQIFRMLRRPDGPAALVVPMRLIQDQPAVEVTIRGEGPFLFLVDTGAADMGRISRELAERFSMEKVGQIVAGDPSGRNEETRDVVDVGQLSIGGRSWSGVEMILPGRRGGDDGIDGILGFELFRDGLLTLDYPAGELRLEPGELGAADGEEILDFASPHGVPNIEIDVAGTPVSADIDSGSMGWLMVPETVARKLPLAGEPVVIGRAATSFNEFEIQAAPLSGELRVGRHVLESPSLHFAGIFPRGNVGGQFLRQFSVTFDQKNRRVRFARDSDRPVTREPRYRVGVMLDRGDGGLVVEGTVPGSPAERAGLMSGDRVLKINGRSVDELPPGGIGGAFGRPEEVLLVVLRGDRELEVRVTPEPTAD